MKRDRAVGVLFKFKDNTHLTLLDNRSKNRFKNLIMEFGDEPEIYEDPAPGDTFEFIDLKTVLDTIELKIKTLAQTPATRQAMKKGTRWLGEIRTINDIPKLNVNNIDNSNNVV